MVALAETTGLLYDPRDLVDELERREQLCSTGIEGGAALLHPRFHDPYMVDDSFICAGVCAQPIPFGAPDGGKTDVFFLVCCQDDRTHLHVLARICVLCHSTELLRELRGAESEGEMYDAVVRAEEAVSRTA
jgi:PTS system nitrogen regulatory IIA component